jgi:hypothetical protein
MNELGDRHHLSRFTFHPLRSTPCLLFLTVFLTVLALYLITLAPGVVGGDAGEHQFAAPLLGIPHTTGYPFYILLGKLWTILFPFGSPAWRMNLFSAVNGALAAAVTALIVYYLTNKPTSYPSSPAPGKGFSPQPSAFPSAVIAGLTLATGLTMWQWSTIAGVRSMNVLFFALITLEAILWQRRMEEWKNGRPDSDSSQPSSRRPPMGNPPTPYLLALLVGLSLAHHRTTLFYLPSLLAWVGWHNPYLFRQPQRWLALTLLGLAPLLLYLFIYLRGVNNPPYSHEKITDWSSFWFLVGSGDSQGLFFSIDPTFLPARLAFVWQDLLAQLSWPGVILATLGGVWLLWWQTRHFLFQALLILLLLLFTLDFEVVNLNEAPTWYLMPAYMLLNVWLGVGVKGMWDMGYGIWARNQSRATPKQPADKLPSSIQNQRPPVGNLPPVAAPGGRPFTIHNSPSHFVIQLTITLFILAFVSYTLIRPNWQTLYTAAIAPLDDWRQLLRGGQAQRLVESSLPYVEPNSIIWGDWEQYTSFKYYQLINGWRPDVTIRNPLDRWPEKVAAAHAAGQPIYFSRKPTDLIGTPYLTMVGPLIYLQTAPQFEAPANLIPLNANFEDELELIGYQTKIWPQDPIFPPPGRGRGQEEGYPAGSILQLTLYWRAPHKLAWDYALSLRLLDAPGQEIYKTDAAHPVLSSYPTTQWQPGEVVGDFYELPLPSSAAPLTLHLLPYRSEGPGQWHNLILNGSEGIKLRLFEAR